MTQIFFLSENLKTFFTESNSTETPLKDADQQVSVNSKCHNINSFNKVTIKRKNSTLATFHLNITSLSKHVDDLHNLALLNHSFDIIGISKHKISNNSNNINFNLPGYTLCYNECASPYRGTGFFFISNNLNFKLRSDLLANEPESLESSFIEITSPTKESFFVVAYITIQV